jgi:hypothetical protein
MSEENPYGGAGQPPGGGQPPYPAYPPTPYAPPRRDRWKIWVGIACALPVLFLTGVVAAAVGSIDQLGWLAGLIGLAAFVGPLVMLFFDGLRKFALGLIIGYAVLFVLAAGACVALLAAYN